MKDTAWQYVYFLCCTPSHLPDTPELADRIGVWATRLYARIKRQSVYDATVYGSKRRGGVGRHCPQALGQTVVITSKQASGAKQAGRGQVGVCRHLSGFDILINTVWPTGHASLGTPSSHAAAMPASQRVCSLIAMAEYLMTGD